MFGTPCGVVTVCMRKTRQSRALVSSCQAKRLLSKYTRRTGWQNVRGYFSADMKSLLVAGTTSSSSSECDKQHCPTSYVAYGAVHMASCTHAYRARLPIAYIHMIGINKMRLFLTERCVYTSNIYAIFAPCAVLANSETYTAVYISYSMRIHGYSSYIYKRSNCGNRFRGRFWIQIVGLLCNFSGSK